MAPVALLSKGPSPSARLNQRAPAYFKQPCLCSTRRVRPSAFGSPRHTSSLTTRQAAAAAPWHTCPRRSRAQARRSALARASSQRSGGPRHVHPLDAGLFEAAADGRLERLVQRFLARLAGRDPEDWGQSAATALLCCVLRAPRPAVAGSLAVVAAFRLASLALAVVLQGGFRAGAAGAPAGPGGAGPLRSPAALPAAAAAAAAGALCAAMACAAARAGHWTLTCWLAAEAALTPTLLVAALVLLRHVDRFAAAGAGALRGTRAGAVMDALRALGLGRGAGPAEVRQTYRALAKGLRDGAARLHPDQNPDPAAHERFRRISAARRLLLQEQERDRGPATNI